jgi:phosphatidylinositol-3-phosphatase
VFATLLAMPARRLASVVALTATTLLAATPSASAAPVPLPRPDHVLVVVMENKDPGEIIGNAAAPYLTGLARAGASFTDAHAETHPSQPNYLALFSGSTQGVTDNGCDHRLSSRRDARSRATPKASRRRARRCARRAATRASTARG